MKNSTIVISAASALMLLSGNTLAQAQTMDWEKQTYLTAIGIKVLPGQEAAIAEHYKTGAGAKVVQARLKANPNGLRWTLLRNVYAGDPAADANYLIASVSKGAPVEPDQAMNDKVARESAGISYADYMQKIRSMSVPLGNTLSHMHHATEGYGPVEGDYVVVRRLKALDNQRQNMLDLARDMQFPLAQERLKEGANKGWSFSHLAFPTGDSTTYDATEVRVFKDLASAVSGSGGGGNGAAMRFAKVFPGKSYTGYVDALRASSKVVRTDLYRVVVSYRK